MHETFGAEVVPPLPPEGEEGGQAGEYFASKLIYDFKGRGGGDRRSPIRVAWA